MRTSGKYLSLLILLLATQLGAQDPNLNHNPCTGKHRLIIGRSRELSVYGPE
jgi:hypothetical protein